MIIKQKARVPIHLAASLKYEVKDDVSMFVTPTVLPLHERLAELWAIHRSQNTLNNKQALEFEMCLDANMKFMWKKAKLESLSLIAYETQDFEWLHQICADIDKLYETTEKK